MGAPRLNEGILWTRANRHHLILSHLKGMRGLVQIADWRGGKEGDASDRRDERRIVGFALEKARVSESHAQCDV